MTVRWIWVYESTQIRRIVSKDQPVVPKDWRFIGKRPYEPEGEW